MDGPHDLGGRQGFGPIDTSEVEVPYHHDWEGRMWGMAQCTDAPEWTIDWWRHVRELIDPVDYLSRPYFDSWAQTQLAAFIESGVISLDEVKEVQSKTRSADSPPGITAAQAIAADRASATRFDVATDISPLFKLGDAVRTVGNGNAGHTRLPAYARNCTGAIRAHHGAHVFPDDNARGQANGQHLYTVMFSAHALWGNSASPADRVYLDLWESYLVAS
ncbi:MAG: nitrile hydratase subunit beta [Pseudomonadota bacterium]